MRNDYEKPPSGTPDTPEQRAGREAWKRLIRTPFWIWHSLHLPGWEAQTPPGLAEFIEHLQNAQWRMLELLCVIECDL
jgi:hypothetical protein